MKAKLATCFTLVATMFVATSASADKLPDPPSAEITSPVDGMMFEGAPGVIDVEVEVLTGTGLDNVDLLVDDVSVGQLTASPWTFTDIELAEGMHTLLVVANGSDGVGYPSESITVAVVAAGDTGEGTGTDGGSAGESGTGTTSEGGSGGESGGSSGSSCSTTSAAGGIGVLGLGLFGLSLLVFPRRRA
jgi:uncharacterized membrane protein YgcG